MAEESFPVVEQPMSADQWASVTLGLGNGILDQGGYPYRLTSFSNVDNTAVLKCPTAADKNYGNAILEGFYHKYDEDIVLSFPPVTSRTTYYVALQYDPLNATTPVTLKVVTSFDYSQGKNYLPLWNVVREPNQLLTNASVRMVRPRVAPLQVYSSEADLPLAHKTLWGTVALIHNGRSGNNAVLKMAITGDDAESVNGWFWKTIYDPNLNGFEWSVRTDSGTYTNPGHGHQRAIGRLGKIRKMRGRVSLVSGNAFQPGNDYQIFSGSIAASDAPSASQGFVVSCGNATPTFATVTVSAAGDLIARVSSPTYWISLDGIEWEVA